MTAAIASAAKIEIPFMPPSLALCEQQLQSGCARCQCTRRFKGPILRFKRDQSASRGVERGQYQMAESSADKWEYEAKVAKRFGFEQQLELPIPLLVPAQQGAAN